MKIFVLIIGLLLAGAGMQSAMAQPGSGGPAAGAADPTAVPLDGGASLLLTAGASYGLRRLRRRPQPQ